MIGEKDYIYVSDVKDSLYVFNRTGDLKIKSHFNLNHTQNSNILCKGNNTDEIKLLSFEDNYIKNYFPVKKLKDSIKIQYKPITNTTTWIYRKGKVQLLIEEYNRILILNEYGLLEQEIQKPQPNLTHILQPDFNTNYFVFGNLTKNELYLLDNFGQQINSKPINGGINHLITNDQLLVYFDSQIWIYDLK